MGPGVRYRMREFAAVRLALDFQAGVISYVAHGRPTRLSRILPDPSARGARHSGRHAVSPFPDRRRVSRPDPSLLAAIRP